MAGARDVSSLAVIGANLFAGTSMGVYLSTNNGASWTAENTGLDAAPLDVSFLAVIGAILFAGTSTDAGTYGGGVYLSTNNGASWSAVNNTGLTDTDVRALAVTGPYLFRGTDDGVWRRPLSEMTGANR